MSDYRKGDVCSLEVTVIEDGLSHEGKVNVQDRSGTKGYTLPTNLTLIRRAPVDLATCDLPVEARWVNSAGPVTITQRGKTRATIAPFKREGV